MESKLPNLDRENFDTWLYFKPDWKEVAYQYHSGKELQNKQDLKAMFWNAYAEIRQKAEDYIKEFEQIPIKSFDDLIFKFREHFPKAGRIADINYFDDLLELFLEKQRLTDSNPFDENGDQAKNKRLEFEHGETQKEAARKKKINETIPVRYKLLNEFFQENEEFKKLKISDQEKLLGFILGCHKDTAKHVKNQWLKYSSTKRPDGKDITQESIDRFSDLSDSLKRGKML